MVGVLYAAFQGTFSQLVDAYCRLGNVSGATKLIEYLKAIDMPISEPICASLVTGHARAGDLQAAESVLQRMKANGQIPHNVVYTRLLCAYAERGDIEAIERVSLFKCGYCMLQCALMIYRCLVRCALSGYFLVWVPILK